MRPCLLFISAAAALFSVLTACGGKGDSGPTGTGDDGAFRPTTDTSLSGSHRFTRIVIPPGVTVTAAGDLVLDSASAVVIDGQLSGDCVAITIRADSVASIGGAISNACRGELPPDAPDLLIVGRGVRTAGARVASSGNIQITNDPSLSAGAFSLGSQRASGGLQPAQGTSDCLLQDTIVLVEPGRALDGAAGAETAGAGSGGASVTVACQGRLELLRTSISSQSGGHGGSSAVETAPLARAAGGAGGSGGDVAVLSTGELAFGSFNALRAGDGGFGGGAQATGPPTTSGAGAVATGGNGGEGGRPIVRARGSIVLQGALALHAGAGGRGGHATARGSDGRPANDSPAQAGGPAAATGGNGGEAPAIVLTADGSLTGVENITVTSGRGGNGGDASARSGNGGDGGVSFPEGAAGGAIEARGGDGGDARATDPNGQPVGAPGDGGEALLRGGVGGSGASACPIAGLDTPVPVAAGKGGEGGAASGGDGAGGQGPGGGTGRAGGVRLTEAANGGQGGNGSPPAAGGDPGDNAVQAIGSLSTSASAQRGASGNACPFSVAFSQRTRVSLAPNGDPAGQDPQIFNVTAASGPPNPNQQPTGGVEIDLFIILVGNHVTIEGPAPWVRVEGTLEPDGSFLAEGTGTIRGVPDSPAVLSGLFIEVRVAGTYTMTPAGSPSVVYQIIRVF